MSAAPPTPVAPPSFADRNFNPDGTRTVEGEAAANEGLASLPTYTTGQAYDPASPAYDSSVNPTLWDKFKDAMPSWETVGNVASIAVPALRVPMTAYNMYKSISNDPSASNVLGSVLSAPISRLTGLTPGTIQSAIKGDFGGAIANQGIGALMGPAMQSVARNYGPDAARALGMANAGFGGTAAAQKSLAGAINNAVSGLGTSAFAGGNTPAQAPETRSAPSSVSNNIANILGISPVVASGGRNQAPMDIVQQLMAMQNTSNNLKSVQASTGGQIDDLIRLTRS
jgi:hypothetical protein